MLRSGKLERRRRGRKRSFRLRAKSAESAIIPLPMFVPPSESFRAYTFWTLSEARSRLYQRRFLRARAHFSAFFTLYHALHFFLCTIPDFCDFSSLCTFLQNFMHFLLIFTGGSWFCSFFVKLYRIFPGISQNFNNFGKRGVKIFIFQKNLRKFANFFQNSDAKLRKICLKKMYALNVFGGNMWRKYLENKKRHGA